MSDAGTVVAVAAIDIACSPSEHEVEEEAVGAGAGVTGP